MTTDYTERLSDLSGKKAEMVVCVDPMRYNDHLKFLYSRGVMDGSINGTNGANTIRAHFQENDVACYAGNFSEKIIDDIAGRSEGKSHS
jgi:hypothetical protein